MLGPFHHHCADVDIRAILFTVAVAALLFNDNSPAVTGASNNMLARPDERPEDGMAALTPRTTVRLAA